MNETPNQENIKQELLARGIKLWKPPYYGVRSHDAALQSLAETLSRESTTLSEQDTLEILRSFRQKALDKLRSRSQLLGELYLKVLLGHEQKDNAPLVVTEESFPETWAEHITMTNTTSAICLTLNHVNPDMTVKTLNEQIITTLFPETPASVRLVHKGKTLTADNGARLADQVDSGTAKILCLVQPQQPSSPNAATDQESTAAQGDDDQILLNSIKTAASKLSQTSAMRLEITDGAGNLVAMTHAERLAFLTALGLHAVGQERLHAQNWSSALFFLQQADEEWNRLETWKQRVDNYGLLQLDICWCFFKLASLDNLDNVLERLENAETQLRKQVNVNFVILALDRAEQGQPVPAIAAMFVRLFLLQGVAHHYAGNFRLKQERLDWAWALAKSLRAVAPPDAVERLLQAGVCDTPSQAVVALRYCNGNTDQAALRIQQKIADAEQAAMDRNRQHEYGLCQNGRDFVNLQLLQQLETVLGLGENDQVASGLLRLSDNNLERAIDLYQECERDPTTVLHRMAQLDQSQGRRRKRTRDDYNVDEMALASLVSMGVEDAVARRALASNQNNVEMALLWVTNNGPPSAENATDAAPGAESPDDQSNNSEVSTSDSARPNAVTGTEESESSRRVAWTPQQVAEREAVELLQRVLGQVLEQQEQDHDEGCLGSSFDEEWGYIEQYRGES